MRKRHPTCSGQCRPLDDTVVDQRIMHDYVVTAEQMPDYSDVRRMATDQGDTILTSVDPRQHLLQLAVDWPFAGDRTARRDGGAVTVDRRLRCVGDVRMTVEPD